MRSSCQVTQDFRLSYGLGLALKLGGIARIELNYCVPVKVGRGGCGGGAHITNTIQVPQSNLNVIRCYSEACVDGFQCLIIQPPGGDH